MRCSQERNSSSRADDVSFASTSAERQPSATRGHFALREESIETVVMQWAKRARILLTRILPTQGADVCDHRFDFFGLHALSVRRHLAFSFVDGCGQVCVRHLRNFRAGKTTHAEVLRGRRQSFSIGPMAGNAFLAICIRRFVLCRCCGGKKESDGAQKR